MRKRDIQNLKSSQSNEWYTPLEILSAARACMGGVIDLDPASCAEANERVGAETYFDRTINGLQQEWQGTVWLNPPYGKIGNKSAAGIWAAYLFDQYNHGSVEQACLLVPNATSTAWFQPLWDTILCFPPRRLAFVNEEGKKVSGNTSGSVIAYLGPHERRFAKAFEDIGHIVWP